MLKDSKVYLTKDIVWWCKCNLGLCCGLKIVKYARMKIGSGARALYILISLRS